MRLSDLGEEGLLGLIRDWTTKNPSSRVALGPGDDAAILEPIGEKQIVVSTDVFRDRVHFSRRYLSPGEIGHRAMAAALSDIAAMGAEGLAAFVNLHAPPEATIEFLRELYAGMTRLADSFSVSIVGGDTVRGELALGITAIGTVEKGRALRRDRAREDDVIFVSGELGGAEAGRLLMSGEFEGKLPEKLRTQAEAHHRTPWPRFDVAEFLCGSERDSTEVERNARANAMIDVSDGLSIDLRRMCHASGVGCRLEEGLVPVNDAARHIARERGLPEVSLALSGGEDFELLFTVAPEDEERMARCAARGGLDIVPIGRITKLDGGHVLVRENASEQPLPEVGYDHFRDNDPVPEQAGRKSG